MSKQIVSLVFQVEVETSDTSPAAVIGIIEDIDCQVSGQLREIRVQDGSSVRHVDYQVNTMHGRKD